MKILQAQSVDASDFDGGVAQSILHQLVVGNFVYILDTAKDLSLKCIFARQRVFVILYSNKYSVLLEQ